MNPLEQDREVLTPEQAGELLQMSAYGVRQLARQRRLPARKVGREWRFLRSELLRWMRHGPAESPLDEHPVWLELAADRMADALDQVESGTSHEVRREWTDAVAAAVRPARYVPGRGLVFDP